MAEVIANNIGEAVIFTFRRKDTLTAADEDARYEKLKTSLVDANIIRSNLDSYFSQTDLKERWENYYLVLNSFFMASSLYFLKNAKENAESII